MLNRTPTIYTIELSAMASNYMTSVCINNPLYASILVFDGRTSNPGIIEDPTPLSPKSRITMIAISITKTGMYS